MLTPPILFATINTAATTPFPHQTRYLTFVWISTFTSYFIGIGAESISRTGASKEKRLLIPLLGYALFFAGLTLVQYVIPPPRLLGGFAAEYLTGLSLGRVLIAHQQGQPNQTGVHEAEHADLT